MPYLRELEFRTPQVQEERSLRRVRSRDSTRLYYRDRLSSRVLARTLPALDPILPTRVSSGQPRGSLPDAAKRRVTCFQPDVGTLGCRSRGHISRDISFETMSLLGSPLSEMHFSIASAVSSPDTSPGLGLVQLSSLGTCWGEEKTKQKTKKQKK